MDRLQAAMGSGRLRRIESSAAAFWRHLETGHPSLQQVGPMSRGAVKKTNTEEFHKFLRFSDFFIVHSAIRQASLLSSRIEEVDNKNNYDMKKTIKNFFSHSDTWWQIAAIPNAKKCSLKANVPAHFAYCCIVA